MKSSFYYTAGDRTIDDAKNTGIESKNPLKSKLISGFKFTSRGKKDLLEFLQSFTDESFIKNPPFSDPNQSEN
ncbi:MAG: hypothetical protein AAFW70_26810 [Cyanobacteria bacterium J06635_10]